MNSLYLNTKYYLNDELRELKTLFFKNQNKIREYYLNNNKNLKSINIFQKNILNKKITNSMIKLVTILYKFAFENKTCPSSIKTFYIFYQLIIDYDYNRSVHSYKEHKMLCSFWEKYYDHYNKISDYLEIFFKKNQHDVYRNSEVNALIKLFETLQNHSNNNYIVGGSVRDIILNKLDIHDFDIVTDIPYDELIRVLSDEYYIKETGKQFLVLNIIHKKAVITFEIANFRKDGVYLDGRRPDTCDIGTLEEDAKRRDFTINSLYYNPINKVFLDPTGQGVLDIFYQEIEDNRKGLLRFIGNAEDRLKEDYLRAWRFYRFSARFIPEDKSKVVIRRNWDFIYKQSNPTRVQLELEKL